MIDFLNNYLSQIMSFIAGAIGGSFITVQIKSKKQYKHTGDVVDQSDSTAGGDIVGRDKKTSTRK